MQADQDDSANLLNLARDRARKLLDRLNRDADDLRSNMKLDPAVARRGLTVLQEAIKSAERLLTDAQGAIHSMGNTGKV